MLAGLSPTWYTYLEQGRDIHPSPEVLNSLARVLRLTEDERRYMHTLAYGMVIGPEPLDLDISATKVLKQIAALTNDSRYPVHGGNPAGDILAWNRASTVWYEDWGKLPPNERNFVHWLLTSPKAKERIVDWEVEARDLIARWRVEMAKSHNDEELQQFVTRFSAVSPEFTDWWNERNVREHRTSTRRLRHPKFGTHDMRMVMMRPTDFPRFGLVFHLPV